eukprot:1216015-Amphidinium_carterae.2
MSRVSHLGEVEDRTTIARALGPGPLRIEEWLEIGRPFLEGRHIILHTDSAKAYAAPFKTMKHTRVVHVKKKVEGRWLEPKYVEVVQAGTDGSDNL